MPHRSSVASGLLYMEYGGSTPFSTARVPVSVVREAPNRGISVQDWTGFRVGPELRSSRTASRRRTPCSL